MLSIRKNQKNLSASLLATTLLYLVNTRDARQDIASVLYE